MRTNCFCLRPRSHRWPEDSEVHRTGVNRGTTPGLQPPVRAVSPADVKRTASGRIVKQRSDATLHTARDPPASMHVHVLGGRQLTECCSTSGVDNCFGHDVNAQRQNDRPVSDKVLAVGKEHRTFLQHLQPLKRKTDLGGKPSTAVATPVLSKSILEASVRRMERHKQHLDVFDDLLQPAAVQTFIDAYLLALAEANQHWADVPEIAALFTPDTILKTQDKQTFHGKTAVLRRLNSGVGMLAKMLSSGTKASGIPKPAITGPERVNSTQWVMTYTFKQGVMKYGIKSQFSFAANKIAMIHSSRI